MPTGTRRRGELGERVDVLDHVLAADQQLARGRDRLRREDARGDQLARRVAGQEPGVRIERVPAASRRCRCPGAAAARARRSTRCARARGRRAARSRSSAGPTDQCGMPHQRSSRVACTKDPRARGDGRSARAAPPSVTARHDRCSTRRSRPSRSARRGRGPLVPRHARHRQVLGARRPAAGSP